MKAISLIFLAILFSCSSHQPPKLSPEEEGIRSSLMAHMEDYRTCFKASETFKKNYDENTKAYFKVGFTIDSHGKVINEKILESDFKEPTFENCLLKAVESIQFPLPKNNGSVDVIQAFNLYPKYK